MSAQQNVSLATKYAALFDEIRAHNLAVMQHRQRGGALSDPAFQYRAPFIEAEAVDRAAGDDEAALAAAKAAVTAEAYGSEAWEEAMQVVRVLCARIRARAVRQRVLAAPLQRFDEAAA